MNYKFNIGSFKCMAVSDGTMTYAPPAFPPPPLFLFANAQKNRLPLVLKEHGISLTDWKEWVSDYTCLLVDTGKLKILIDTGAGKLAENTGKLIHELKQEKISPEDIDLVILTHAHPDHVGGNLDSDGNPLFPGARWAICKDEWDFWISEEAGKSLDEHSREILIGIARKNLLPLEKKIELLEKETEIVSGIRTIFAPGHTPGHMAVSITSGKDKLMCLSDLLVHPIHITQPGWFCATDIYPERMVASRCRLLDKAAEEKCLVMAFHFPFPGLGYIKKKNQGWGWQPLTTR